MNNEKDIIIKYLEESLKPENKAESEYSNLCSGWKWLENNSPECLNKILNLPEYDKIVYNSFNAEFILKKFDLPIEYKKRIEAWVYIQKAKKREQEKAEEIKRILAEGYKEINNDNKELDGKKVKIILDIETLSIFGNSEVKKEKEGKLVWSEYQKCLMLMPSRHIRKGYILKGNAYVKYL